MFFDNQLDKVALDSQWLTGIIDARPSKGAKGPSIWNPTFDAICIPVNYQPFNMLTEKLGLLVETLRARERYLGGSTTVPHKVEIMQYLDEIEEKAAPIGAINTIARSERGKLIGYNTDGHGGSSSWTKTLPGHKYAFLPILKGSRVLLLAASGAAGVLAFFLPMPLGKAI